MQKCFLMIIFLCSSLYSMDFMGGSKNPILSAYAYYQLHNDSMSTFVIEKLLNDLNPALTKKERWHATLSLAVIAELCPSLMNSYLGVWTSKVAHINDDGVFPVYTAPDGSQLTNLEEISDDGGLAYFKLPPYTTGKACKHVVVEKEGREIYVEEKWVILSGDGELVQGNAEGEWGVPEKLFPGKVATINFGCPFQFRSGENGLLIHDITTPPWPGAEAADNTVDSYWSI